ncbi:MAG TPA: twin-arginine translocase TatA/TatE family subunit [Euryarchaeota archaeon]|nr:twin-arginine translocase TatA/TatE family subunit [Euryarchaeota archaeon]
MTTGGTEILVVLAIAVMLFGPKKLPELARTMGEAMGEYHKATREFENEVRKASTSVDREITSATSVEPRKIGPAAQTRPARPASTRPAGAPTTRPVSEKPAAPSSDVKVKEIAKNLGIDTANKTDAQLLREISIKTKKQELTKG